MNYDTLINNLETITEAPGGMSSFRALVFNLAVSGRLVEQIDLAPSAVDSVPENLKKSFSHADLVDWLLLPLTECVEIYNGNSTSATEKNRLAKVVDGRPLVATKDVGYGFQPISLDTGLKVPLVDTQYKIAPANAVLICLEGGSAGKKMGLLSQEVCFGNKLFANVCKPWIDSKYLLICLLSSNFSSQFQMQLSGIIGGISKAKYGQIKIPLPPLSEQKRIVAKVDGLMALCDELELQREIRNNLRTATRKSAIDAISTASSPEELETAWNRISNNWDVIADAPESVATLRSLVLDLAVTGSLVPDNKDSISIVKSLGLSQEDFTFSPMRANWINIKLDKCFQIAGGIQKTPKRSPKQNAFPYLRVANVHRGTLDLNEISKFELESGELERYKLEEGDLLIVEGNGSQSEIGRCARWSGEIPNCVHQNHIIRCRPKILGLEDFVMLYLNSSIGKKTMTELAITTSGLYSLSVGKIRNITISIPPLSLQKQIVAKVKVLMALCDELETAMVTRSALVEKFARSVVSAA